MRRSVVGCARGPDKTHAKEEGRKRGRESRKDERTKARTGTEPPRTQRSQRGGGTHASLLPRGEGGRRPDEGRGPADQTLPLPSSLSVSSVLSVAKLCLSFRAKLSALFRLFLCAFAPWRASPCLDFFRSLEFAAWDAIDSFASRLPLHAAFVKFLTEEMERKQISVAELARRTKCSQATIYAALAAASSPRLADISRILSGLEIQATLDFAAIRPAKPKKSKKNR